jgi:uncharacterized protein YxeA
MVMNKTPNENKKIFNCEFCDYTCSKNSEYIRHLLTKKHIGNASGNKKITTIKCNFCNKIYKSKKGLWGHNKLCSNVTNITENKIIQEESIGKVSITGASISGASISGASISGASISGASISGASISGASISGASINDASNNVIQLLINENKELINDNKDFKNMIMELVKSNNDLQKQMVEVCQKIQPGNTVINNNTNTNSHNKTFNLQVFLNEECKDAMNMSDFINSIEIKVSDLVNIGKLGYVEGMSNIIIKQLNDTDMYKRPVHCSDAKRETLYVKEENKWEKDTQETKQMLTAVRGVNKKNYTLLANWKETHPDCMSSKSNQSDEYMKVVSKVMDGDIENINKVIKKVSKQVIIDK